MKKFKISAAEIIVVCLLVLVGCGGGGSSANSAPGIPNEYAGLTTKDFAGRTLYLVDFAGYAKAEFFADGTLKAYQPNQDYWFQSGIWSIEAGTLVVAQKEYPNDKTVYVYTKDDTGDRFFEMNRYYGAEPPEAVVMFYDQTTGLAQAQAFVNEQRIP